MLAYLGQGTAGITDQVAFSLLVGEGSDRDVGAEMVLYVLLDNAELALMLLLFFATRRRVLGAASEAERLYRSRTLSRSLEQNSNEMSPTVNIMCRDMQ